MGCASSQEEDIDPTLDDSPRYNFKKRSSFWNVSYGDAMSAEDWHDILQVWTQVRAQGTEIDIVTYTFQKIIETHPKVKILLIDFLGTGQDLKTSQRFRAHMREVSTSLNKIIEYKTTDEVAFDFYIRDLWELHYTMKGFDPINFQMFSQTFHDCLLILMGPSITKKQSIAFHKFTIYLYKILVGEVGPAARIANRKNKSLVKK